MDDLVRRLALRLKIHKIGGNVVHHVALLKRALDNQGIDSEMIRGFCVIPETKEACDHYWVREKSTGLDMDVAFTLAKLKSPDLQALCPVLLESLPSGMNRSDEKETMIREENERLFELYQRDPKAFWREAPRDVTSFRATQKN